MRRRTSTPGLSTWWSTTALMARPGFAVGFPLRCVQRLSCPNLATGCAAGATTVHQRFVHPGPLVLGAAPRKSRTPTADRDRTVSRRSKPSSRTTLIGEQPNPWDLLQPQDVMSRHRGAKQPRRWELLGLSACYPRRTFYPLSDGPSTRDHRITSADFRLAARRPCSQAGSCACTRLPVSDGMSPPSRASVTLWEDRPCQTARHAGSRAGSRPSVRHALRSGWFQGCLHPSWRPGLVAPTYLHRAKCVPVQTAVRVRGVFPSDRRYPASSRGTQFASGRWSSGEVVTPFVQVGTFPTRNFASLGPL